MKGPKNKAKGNPKPPMNYTLISVVEGNALSTIKLLFLHQSKKIPSYIFSSVNSSHYMLFDREFQPSKKHYWVTKMPLSRKK